MFIGMTGLKRNYQKILAFVLSAIIFCMLLAASVFIVFHADHECSGRDCPVCDEIRQAEAIFRMTGDGTAAAIISASLICLVSLAAVPVYSSLSLAFSLVGQKVQLNN